MCIMRGGFSFKYNNPDAPKPITPEQERRWCVLKSEIEVVETGRAGIGIHGDGGPRYLTNYYIPLPAPYSGYYFNLWRGAFHYGDSGC